MKYFYCSNFYIVFAKFIFVQISFFKLSFAVSLMRRLSTGRKSENRLRSAAVIRWRQLHLKSYFHHIITRNALSVRSLVRHVFYPQRDNGAQSERLLSDSRCCLVKPIVISCCVVTRPERPKGVKDVIKQARRAQSRPEGPQPRSRGPEGP